MNRQIDDNELLHEIAPYAGKASDVLLKIIRQWQSSLPALEDTLTSNDIIEKAKTGSHGIQIKKLVAMFATGIAAIVIAGVMLFTHYFSGTMEKAVCTAVIGDVHVIRGNQSVPLMNGMGIQQRDRIICGKGSMAVIEMGSLKLRVDQNSEFAIDTVQSKGKLLLDTSMTHGVIYATIAKLKKGDSVFVKTKTAVASIRGTTFMIKSNNNITKLIVLEGKVMIAPRLDIIPQESTPGVVVDVGQACVVDAGTIIAIKKAVSMNTTELDTIIQQSLPVTIADKKIIQIIETLTRDINQAIPVNENELTLNALYNIKAVVPDNNDVLVTTSDG
ncbi:MAG TPA: FecR family protein, partial [Spirochaetota bacterium]|nr:FecR family protein [Spirochaetota bacterium]